MLFCILTGRSAPRVVDLMEGRGHHGWTARDPDMHEFDALVSRLIAEQKNEDLGYDGLDFKELLTVAPLEGIELTRSRELPREIEF